MLFDDRTTLIEGIGNNDSRKIVQSSAIGILSMGLIFKNQFVMVVMIR